MLDAILAASEGQSENRQLWLTDLDCVWLDAERVFAAAPPADEIGCIQIGYALDWDGVGTGDFAVTRESIGELARSIDGASDPAPPWIGGELLSGTASALRELVASCEDIDARLAGRGEALLTEEQVLTLAGALGRVRFRELSAVAGRVHTSPRHGAVPRDDSRLAGLWHLSSEKGGPEPAPGSRSGSAWPHRAPAPRPRRPAAGSQALQRGRRRRDAPDP